MRIWEGMKELMEVLVQMEDGEKGVANLLRWDIKCLQPRVHLLHVIEAREEEEKPGSLLPTVLDATEPKDDCTLVLRNRLWNGTSNHN